MKAHRLKSIVKERPIITPTLLILKKTCTNQHCLFFSNNIYLKKCWYKHKKA